MQELLRSLLPLALGVAASPVAILGVLVILLTKSARLGGLLFSAAWAVGVTLALSVAIAFAGRISPPARGLDLGFEGLVTLALGVVAILAAGWWRRRRISSPATEGAPAWVEAVDGMSPAGGVVVAFLNATTSPKNLALALAAGALISGSSAGSAEKLTSEVVYVALATVPVAVPVLIYLVGGRRSDEVLIRWKHAITLRAAGAIDLAIFVVGLVLTARGLAGLFG